jgi:alpha-L-fucosidase 2
VISSFQGRSTFEICGIREAAPLNTAAGGTRHSASVQVSPSFEGLANLVEVRVDLDAMEDDQYTRRKFVTGGVKAGALISAENSASLRLLLAVADGSKDGRDRPVIDVDHRALVSHADLSYASPVTRSEAGQPLGNGRTGSLVWTTPTTVHLQVNRVDVYAQNKDTLSFPERNTDYSSGCGYVDLDFCDFGEDVFAGSNFKQHLSVYDGIVTISGGHVTVRVLACAERDVFAIEVEDSRRHPLPIHVDLRMLRYLMQYIPGENWKLAEKRSVKIVTHNHTATSTLSIRDGQIVLRQEFREKNYYNSSAVAIRVVGRASKAKYANESNVRLGVDGGRGKFTVLVASASSFDAEQDVEQKAIAELNAVGARSFDAVAASTSAWWHRFWSKGFVRMQTENPDALEIERNYTYYLYVMAASSRGTLIPKYGGMLWYTNGDMRAWGAQHWWHNGSST